MACDNVYLQMVNKIICHVFQSHCRRVFVIPDIFRMGK